jgi:hypothetical protein
MLRFAFVYMTVELKLLCPKKSATSLMLMPLFTIWVATVWRNICALFGGKFVPCRLNCLNITAPTALLFSGFPL